MTRCTAHLTTCMASEDPARMGVAIQVTGKALFIAGDTGELARVDDVPSEKPTRRACFRVRDRTRRPGPSSVSETAGLADVVRVLSQAGKDILMARLTRFRPT